MKIKIQQRVDHDFGNRRIFERSRIIEEQGVTRRTVRERDADGLEKSESRLERLDEDLEYLKDVERANEAVGKALQKQIVAFVRDAVEANRARFRVEIELQRDVVAATASTRRGATVTPSTRPHERVPASRGRGDGVFETAPTPPRRRRRGRTGVDASRASLATPSRRWRRMRGPCHAGRQEPATGLGPGHEGD